MAEWGPMRLIISSFVGKVPQREMNVDAARYSFEVLERIARAGKDLCRVHTRIPDSIKDPLVLEMIRSTVSVEDADLTPMASVAGTIADAVADRLADRGMTKVIVNNGGDIAVRLQEEPALVGIRGDVREVEFSHVVRLGPERSSWGVATSGLGGRSLTRGIVSAATIIAFRASAADAAATAVANAGFVDAPGVMQEYAEKIDPNTDIPGIRVTVKVEALAEDTKVLALKLSLARAVELMDRDVIEGAFIAVGDKTGMTESVRKRLIMDEQ